MTPAESSVERHVLEEIIAEAGRQPPRVVLVASHADAWRAWAQDSNVSLVRTPAELRGLADASHDVVATSDPVRDRPAPEAMRAIQRVLRPGGAWILLRPHANAPTASRTRRLRGDLLHYFASVEILDAPGRPLVARTRATEVRSHFDALASDYGQELPTHLRDHYVANKVQILENVLPRGEPGAVGLDLGSGPGWYTSLVAERTGARVIGVDASVELLRRTSAEPATRTRYLAADCLRLPFRAGSFDFAYAINLLHHLKRGEQERCVQEIRRVLKPRAPFVLLEVNTRNALFRWYMRRVFPRVRRIDRGDEEFIHPDALPLWDAFRVEAIHYCTFAPDFLPSWALAAFRPLERLLERSPAAPHAIHYAAVLRPR